MLLKLYGKIRLVFFFFVCGCFIEGIVFEEKYTALRLYTFFIFDFSLKGYVFNCNLSRNVASYSHLFLCIRQQLVNIGST